MMVAPDRTHGFTGRAAALLLLGSLAAGCAGQQPPTVAQPGIGTVAGAVGGAALGRAAAGENNNLAAILAGAAVGGLAGNLALDRPAEERRRLEAEAAKDEEYRRRLEYDRQSALQEEEVRREIEERRLFEEWKRQRYGGASAPTPVSTQADVLAAQRYLTALGYYRGPLDGIYGPQTRSAVMRFEASQGLPQTGVITPDLVQRMRAAI